MAAGFITLDGDGDYAETGDKAALKPGTSDLEIIWLGDPDNNFDHTVSNPDQVFVAKQVSGGDFNLTYKFDIDGVAASGQFPRLRWKESDGTIVQQACDADLGAVMTEDHVWVRVTLDVDNGASGNDISFFFSNDPIDTPVGSVSWTQLGPTETDAGVTDFFDSPSPVTVGAAGGGSTNPYAGKVYGAWVFYDGAEVANPDWRDGDQGWASPPGTDDHSNSWTLEGDTAWTADTPPEGARLVGRSVHYDFENKQVVIESGV